MPVNFLGSASSFPESAFFPPLETIDSIIARLPGFRGAWDAADYTGSGPWLPRIAPAENPYRIVPALTGTAPVRADRNGRPVLRFMPNGKAWINDATGGTPTIGQLAYASRAYFSNVDTNFQKVFDLGAPEFYFRSTMATPVWQMAGLGAAATAPIRAPVIGWHSFVFRKPAGQAGLTLDSDGSETVFGSEGALSGILQIGDAGSATSAQQDIARLIICDNGAISTAGRAAMMLWVGG
jgi:hypothetical protein